MPSEVWEEVTYPFPMDNQFHATFYDGCNYSFVLGLELINNSKRVSRYTIHLTLHILCWLSLGYSECTSLDPVSIYRPPFQSWDFRYAVRRSYIYNENPNVGIHIEPVPQNRILHCVSFTWIDPELLSTVIWKHQTLIAKYKHFLWIKRISKCHL